MRPRLALLALFLSTPLSAQAVLVVDDDGPADFAELGQAVAEAADGDVVLVRAGTYDVGGALVLGAKSLVLAAERGASVVVTNGALQVRALPAGGTVLVQGLAFAPLGPDWGGSSVLVEDCDGVVQLEDVVVPASSLPIAIGLPVDGILVEDSAQVVLARASVVGASAVFPPQPGGAGLRAVRSSVHLHESSLVGATGAGGDGEGQPGGPGVLLEDGFLFAAGSTLRGGDGGTVGNHLGCFGLTAGDGGAGIRLAGSAPDAHLLDTATQGGEGGGIFLPFPGPTTCVEGSPGVPSEVLAGTLADVAWPTHGFALESPVAAGEGTTLSFAGVPGEFAWYLYAGDASTLFLPALVGTLALGFPLFAVPAGTLDGAGAASVSVPVALAAGAQGTRFHLQALYLDTQANVFTLSTPAALVVLADGL